MVLTTPFGPTDSTMPMCSSQTIRSPGWGVAPLGSALWACCAQAYSASTEPKPPPFGPTGTPASLATQEVKYAHQGPGPGAPAVALRYWAMRGELLEPGGDSATPTSRAAIATIFWPALPFAGTAAVPATPVAPAAVGLIAPWSIDAKSPDPPAVVPVAGAAGVVLGAATGGANAAFSSLMRAMTVWRLTSNRIDTSVPTL